MIRSVRFHESPDRVNPLEISSKGSPTRCLVCRDCDSIITFFLEWAADIEPKANHKENVPFLTARCRCPGRIRQVSLRDLTEGWGYGEPRSRECWWRDTLLVERAAVDPYGYMPPGKRDRLANELRQKRDAEHEAGLPPEWMRPKERKAAKIDP